VPGNLRMIKIKPVHTLDARDHVMLEVVRDFFNLSSERMLREIQSLRYQVEDELLKKGISYEN
jgi:hypothetical protein